MKILFFDTETTGIPKNWNEPVHNLNSWPRLVQLAWQVYDENECLIEEHDFIVKPKGFSIPIESTNIHKITTEKANEVGEDLDIVLQLFYKSIKESNLLVAHNYSYDFSIMGSELLRNGYNNILEKKENICTMKSSTDFCKIPGPYGYKWPKLEELYSILFNASFNAHNALDDIRATARCYWELISLGIIKPFIAKKQAKILEFNEMSLDIINKSFKKAHHESIKNFELQEEILFESDSTRHIDNDWTKMYKQSLKLKLHHNDREKFKAFLYDRHDFDFYRDPLVPEAIHIVDFDYDAMEEDYGKSPYQTSTILWTDNDKEIFLEQNYYRGVLICEKFYAQGKLTRYIEYCFHKHRIIYHKEYNEKGKLISLYSNFKNDNKLTYYIYFGGKSVISSIQFYYNEMLLTIIRYDNMLKVKHIGTLKPHNKFGNLDYIVDVNFHESNLGYVKSEFITKGFFNKKNELFTKYVEIKIGDKIWKHTYSTSKNRDFHGCGELENITENETEILKSIHKQNPAELILFYDNRLYSKYLKFHTNYKVNLNKLMNNK